jgi:ABC-type Fe3+-siderophore transport system permease subunit
MSPIGILYLLDNGRGERMNAIIAGIAVGVFLVILSWVLPRSFRQKKGIVFYPGIAGLAGGAVLLVCSFSLIGGWEGIGYAFFAVSIIVISLLLLLVLTSYKRQT